jgi:ribose-phosphate pyrophosphokinase
MTTMAVTEPPLKRLFERLDFAPRPMSKELGVVLERWREARLGVIAPRRKAVSFSPQDRDAFETSFVHRLAEVEDDSVLTEGEAAASTLLGAGALGRRLSQAADRRGAVRLRRLLKEVRQSGQPVLAEFTLIEDGRDRALVELLVAPLSEDGKTIDSALSAISVHAFDAAAPAWPARRSLEDRACLLFALGASRPFGEQVAQSLGLEVSALEDREFEDAEYKIRPLVEVRGRDVFALFSLNGDEEQSGADKLCKLLFFIGALKDAGAAHVTAVVPYLCFARKDRRTKPRDPITTRYVAQLFEAIGTDRLMVVDVHNVAAFQNAFRRETVHLDAQTLFAQRFAADIGDAPVAVVSPDLGGEKRAELFRQRLERLLKRSVGKGFMDKYRSEGRVVSDIFAGDVKGRTAIVLDDLISGGGTMARTAVACRTHGATQVWIAATHGVFSSAAATVLRDAPIDKVLITDTISPVSRDVASALGKSLTIVSVAALVAEAIRRCHSGGSIADLLESGP